jgi:hypothetical protein
MTTLGAVERLVDQVPAIKHASAGIIACVKIPM